MLISDKLLTKYVSEIIYALGSVLVNSSASESKPFQSRTKFMRTNYINTRIIQCTCIF